MHAFWLVLTYDLLEDRRIDDVIVKTFLILYYIKQIDSKLPCVCSVKDHRGRQNVVRTEKWHTRRSRVCHGCSDVLCDLLLNRRTATWNLFVNCMIRAKVKFIWIAARTRARRGNWFLLSFSF